MVSAGYGHASPILACSFSPCGKMIVTGGKSGAVFIWKVPEVIGNKLILNLFSKLNCFLIEILA